MQITGKKLHGNAGLWLFTCNSDSKFNLFEHGTRVQSELSVQVGNNLQLQHVAASLSATCLGATDVGHFALVEPLLPKLRAQSHPSRVVLVSSMGHMFQVQNFLKSLRVAGNQELQCVFTHRCRGAKPLARRLSQILTVIIHVCGEQRSPLDLDDLHYENRPYGRIAAYGQSKAANVMFAKEVAER